MPTPHSDETIRALCVERGLIYRGFRPAIIARHTWGPWWAVDDPMCATNGNMSQLAIRIFDDPDAQAAALDEALADARAQFHVEVVHA